MFFLFNISKMFKTVLVVIFCFILRYVWYSLPFKVGATIYICIMAIAIIAIIIFWINFFTKEHK